MSAFADAGVNLSSVYGNSGAKLGFVILAPDPTGAIHLQILVAETPQQADHEMVNARELKRLHPKMLEGRATRQGNLFISYRNHARERDIVRRGLRKVAQQCA